MIDQQNTVDLGLNYTMKYCRVLKVNQAYAYSV